MDTKWFTNRGQMLQLAVASVGVVVGILGWLAVPPQNLLNIIPPWLLSIIAQIVFWASILWLASLLGTTWLGKQRIAETTRNIPEAERTTPELPVTLRKGIVLTSFTCELGGFWEGEVVDRTFRIAVHKIRKIKEEYEADVQIVDGVGATTGGPETTRIGAARFWMPVSARPVERRCIYAFDLLPLLTRIIILRVEHINPRAKNVQLQLCYVNDTPKTA